MPSIHNSDFVKSKHISNIVSESAKIAIRDYIDNLTIKSNDKVEKIAAELTQKMIEKFTDAGKKIPVLLEIKQEVMNLAE
jgi:transposase-like protein